MAETRATAAEIPRPGQLLRMSESASTAPLIAVVSAGIRSSCDKTIFFARDSDGIRAGLNAQAVLAPVRTAPRTLRAWGRGPR